MDANTTDLELPNGGDGIHCQDRLVSSHVPPGKKRPSWCRARGWNDYEKAHEKAIEEVWKQNFKIRRKAISLKECDWCGKWHIVYS